MKEESGEEIKHIHARSRGRARGIRQQARARAPASSHNTEAAMLADVMATVQSVLGFAPSQDQVNFKAAGPLPLNT